MQFKDKLTFLMKLSQITNKELADAISVDPSLISLLRSGKRRQPQNQKYISAMASFFASRCTADFQRNALAEMLGQSVLRSSLPIAATAERLNRWLSGDSDMIDQMVETIDAAAIQPRRQEPLLQQPVLPQQHAFYFGVEGRRQTIQRTLQYLLSRRDPQTVYLISDDDLSWMLSNYTLAKRVQSGLLELLERGFVIHQIMPAMNFVSRYTEALRFWLPLYSTGKMKVYYYPRLRDNLYRHSSIIVPGCCIHTATCIGLDDENHISMFSTDPQLIETSMKQVQKHLSLCRPAMHVYTDAKTFASNVAQLYNRTGDIIQMVSPLPVNTMPPQLIALCQQSFHEKIWKDMMQLLAERHPLFEKNLEQRVWIDMAPLASAEDIRAGKISIACPYSSYPEHLCYTPETYVMHLEYILYLLEHYESYHFIPYNKIKQSGYSLIANEGDLALLFRTMPPALMLEMERPEMVQACREHLLRIAEGIGYDGIQRLKTVLQIRSLIQELQQQY